MRSLLRLVVTEGHRQESGRAGLSGRRQDRHRPRNIGGHYRRRLVTSFAGVFPMDEPRYVMVMMLDEPKATAGNLSASHRRAGTSARRSAPPSAASRRCSASARTRTANLHVAGASLRSRRRKALNDMNLSDLAGIDSDSEVTGFAIDHRKVAAGNVFGAFRGRRVQRRGFHRRRGRTRRGCRRGPRRGVGRRRAASCRRRAAPAVRRISRRDSSARIRRRSSRSPAPTARPRRSR